MPGRREMRSAGTGARGPRRHAGRGRRRAWWSWGSTPPPRPAGRSRTTARAGDVGVLRRPRVGQDVPREAEGAGEGVDEAGEPAPEGVVEAAGEVVEVVPARARRAEHPRPRHAPYQPDVDEGKPPGAHRVHLLNGGGVVGDEADVERGGIPPWWRRSTPPASTKGSCFRHSAHMHICFDKEDCWVALG
jgi:hypothetical protein